MIGRTQSSNSEEGGEGGTALRDSEEGSVERQLARARTLTVLERLDGTRKSQVLQFLMESDLLEQSNEKDIPPVSLIGANLSNVDVSEVAGPKGKGADLLVVNLSKSNLQRSDLSGAFGTGVNLMEADLSLATLEYADLASANLRDADLTHASLRGANLILAKLSGADLSGADLEGAEGVSTEELEEQAWSLAGATMPDGSKHD